MFRTWNRWWLDFQLVHGSLFNLQGIISAIIVPHCFQVKRVLTFQLDVEMWRTDLPPGAPAPGERHIPLSLTWCVPFCFARRRCHPQVTRKAPLGITHERNPTGVVVPMKPFLACIFSSEVLLLNRGITCIILFMFYDCLPSLHPLCVGTTSRFLSML